MQFLSKTVLKKFIKKEISSIGFDEGYINSAVKKHLFLSIKIFSLTPSQATILKQTALSSGCDCAVNRGVIDCSVEYSDCILSGTVAQIETVAKKLSNQPFSLSHLSDTLVSQLDLALNPSFETKIVGILNVTEDSFSDGGEYLKIEKAINHAVDMIEQGAKIIDIGAQSSRPNAGEFENIDIELEIQRIVPIIVALKASYPNIELSVDTKNIPCAIASVENGCDIINDVSFLADPDFIRLCAKHQKKLVIMHSRGNSSNMDELCEYSLLIDEIYKELYNKTQSAISLGLDVKNIIIDLGFGFAKTFGQNFELLKRINEFKSLGYPILAGVSRKRFLQDVINTKEPKDADLQTTLAVSHLIQQGVEYIRVHNVKMAVEALKFCQRLEL